MSPTFLANRKRRGQGSGQPWSRGRTGGFPERGEPECGAQTVVLILPRAGEQHLPRDDRRRESGAEMRHAAQRRRGRWSPTKYPPAESRKTRPNQTAGEKTDNRSSINQSMHRHFLEDYNGIQGYQNYTFTIAETIKKYPKY